MQELTNQEKLFFTRCALVLLEDPQMTFEQAARAVLNRDRELVELLQRATEAGDAARGELCRQIYEEARKG